MYVHIERVLAISMGVRKLSLNILLSFSLCVCVRVCVCACVYVCVFRRFAVAEVVSSRYRARHIGWPLKSSRERPIQIGQTYGQLLCIHVHHNLTLDLCTS